MWHLVWYNFKNEAGCSFQEHLSGLGEQNQGTPTLWCVPSIPYCNPAPVPSILPHRGRAQREPRAAVRADRRKNSGWRKEAWRHPGRPAQTSPTQVTRGKSRSSAPLSQHRAESKGAHLPSFPSVNRSGSRGLHKQ